VQESFYAQHQLESLTLGNTLIEEMNGSGAGKTDLEYRALLGAFLFSGDDVEKKIKILSGGEKARVALAKTIVSKANFLILDEPTNHLDIHSVELLVQALNKYEGSIILVSHDRYFISKAANKIWEIIDGEIKEFKGTYAEWVEWKERMENNSRQAAAAGQQPVGAGLAPAQKTANKTESNKPAGAGTSVAQNTAKPVVTKNETKPTNGQPFDKEAQKEYQKQKKIFDKLEEDVNEANSKKTGLEAQLSDPQIYSDRAKFQQAEKAYADAKRASQTLQTMYEAAFEKLMELEEKV
jgi:ATP-binding cassette subfamily F protein 3